MNDIFSLQLQSNREPFSLESLTNSHGLLTEAIILTAYSHPKYMSYVVKLIERNASKVGKIRIKIFLDYSASGVHSDQKILSAYRRIETSMKSFTTQDSGIFLVNSGRLFHPKLLCFSSKKNTVAYIGSANLSNSGFKHNEEILMRINGKKASEVSRWLATYIESLPIDRISEVSQIGPTTLRGYLLQGRLFYTAKQSSPFRYNLHLPDDLLERRSDVDELLEGKDRNSIDIRQILANGRVGLGLRTLKPKTEKQIKDQVARKWRRFGLQTSLGLWMPNTSTTNVVSILDQLASAADKQNNLTRSLIKSNRAAIDRKFSTLCDRIVRKVEAAGLSWERETSVRDRWASWREQLEAKLAQPAFLKRLGSDIRNAKVPDIWSDELSAEEFENSFLDELLFQWSKSDRRDNIVANDLATALGSKDFSDAASLRTAFEAHLNAKSVQLKLNL